jgi:hypothetical protein
VPSEKMIECGEIQIHGLNVYRVSSPNCNSKGSRIIVYDWSRVSFMDKEETFMQLLGHLEVCKN